MQRAIVDVEVLYRAPASPGGEEVTGSPVVLVRRVPSSPKMPAAPEGEPHR